jgi:hypothetical protein
MKSSAPARASLVFSTGAEDSGIIRCSNTGTKACPNSRPDRQRNGPSLGGEGHWDRSGSLAPCGGWAHSEYFQERARRVCQSRPVQKNGPGRWGLDQLPGPSLMPAAQPPACVQANSSLNHRLSDGGHYFSNGGEPGPAPGRQKVTGGLHFPGLEHSAPKHRFKLGGAVCVSDLI